LIGEDVLLVTVPGALEIPLALAKAGRIAVSSMHLIALGAVIRGETYHFELVSNESGAGISRVSRSTSAYTGCQCRIDHRNR
jgi:6,7-dimethyl-8-ribityllumazine synthase